MPKLAQLTKEQLDNLSQKLHETIKYTRQEFTYKEKRLLVYIGEEKCNAAKSGILPHKNLVIFILV